MRRQLPRFLWGLILAASWLLVPGAPRPALGGCEKDGAGPDGAERALTVMDARAQSGPQVTSFTFSNPEGFARNNVPEAWRYGDTPVVIPCRAGGPNPRKVDVRMRGDNGDADLYVRFGARPDDLNEQYDGRPFIGGSNESVTIQDPCGDATGPRELYVGARAWSPFENATVEVEFEVPEAPPAKRQKCLDDPKEDGTHNDLPPEIKAGWGTPERRDHHSTWHAIEFGWDRLSSAQQRELRAVGWGPPEDCDGSGNCTRHSQEQVGLDFVCMHRNMVKITENAYAALAARDGETEPCRNQGWTAETFPWNLPDSNRDNDVLWPTIGRPNSVKSERSARQMRSQVTSTFFNDNWLKGNEASQNGEAPSLGQMMRAVERSFHNWMHMRFADDQPSGDVCATDWLGSTCSSQQNEYFWKLHGLIDSLPQKWARANAGTTAELIRGVEVPIPASFGLPEGDPNRASDEEVYAFTTRLLGYGDPIEGVPQHNCWRGPMPGPIEVGGVIVRGVDPTVMSPQMAAANVAKTKRAIEIMSDESLGPDMFQNWVSDSIRQSILTVPQMMASILDPAAKQAIEERLKALATERFDADANRIYPAVLDNDERDLLTALLHAPEDFQKLTPIEATLLQRAIDKLKVSDDPLAEQIRDIIRQNPAVMEIPEVKAALQQNE